MITAIVCSLVAGGLIGAIIGAFFSDLCPCCHWDYDIKSGKLASLETQLFLLEQENRRLMSHPFFSYRPVSYSEEDYLKDKKMKEVKKLMDTAKISLDEAIQIINLRSK